MGNKQALPFLLEGLKALEYRGYDSAGFCINENGVLRVVKRKGKVAELEKEANGFKGTVGIAHTRWATHGQPNEANAHPHLDCNGQIAIVHNGIIENYHALREILEQEGHKIVSQTDSEIIAHMVEKFYQGNMEEAVLKALHLLEGAYGLLVMDAHAIVAAKKSSPLLLGIGEKELWLASDASAVLPYTKKVIYLNDGQIATVTKGEYAVKDLDGAKVDTHIEEIAMTVEQISKKGFKHFMLKEIFEQPEAIENTLRGRIRDGKVKLSVNFNVKDISRIILTACGTSWHSALIGKYLIEKIANIPVEVDYASEFRYRNPIVRQNDLLIVMSQSGETADTLAALREAKARGAKTLGIINVVGSTIAREVDSGIYLHAGPEIGVASTKAFTCQVTALLLLALYMKQEAGGGIDTTLLEAISRLPDTIRETLKVSEEIRGLAEAFRDSKNFLYLGRNVNFPVALEGALKLKEISYIHAEGYPAAEMKHGPIALVDEEMPVVFVSPKDGSYAKVLSNMEEIRARGGNIIAVVNNEDEAIAKLSKHIIHMPEVADELSPIISVIPLQLLAYHIADLKGLNVDKPRNLAKSVTVE